MFKKRMFLVYFTVFFMFGFFDFLFSGISNAATHYVSPTGNDSWSNSRNIDTPCSVSKAFANANAGDTVYFRGGTYSVSAKNFADTYHGYYAPAHSGTAENPITFVAYPGETPLFDGTAGGTGDTPDFATIFGVYLKTYIIYDGFSFQANGGTKRARMLIGTSDTAGTHHVTIRNCVFNGGLPIRSTDNRSGLSVHYSTNVTVQRCRFYGYKEPTDNHNTTAFLTYHSSNLVLESNEIYGCSHGLFLKSDADYAIVRYNYLHDNHLAVMITSDMIGMETDNVQIYHNVIANNSYGGIIDESGDHNTHGNNFEIFNNTLYSNGTYGIHKTWSQSGYGAVVYNNISVGSTRTFSTSGKATDVSYIKQADHNQWGTGIKIRISDNYNAREYTSLAAWQASNELENAVDVGCGSNQHPGCGDLSGGPLFVNTSGNMNTLADFALQAKSPAKRAGRGGVDIGANIDLVGILHK